MLAMILVASPHCSQVWISILNTHLHLLQRLKHLEFDGPQRVQIIPGQMPEMSATSIKQPFGLLALNGRSLPEPAIH